MSETWSGRRIVVVGAVAGTLGGAMMAMVEMAYGLFSDVRSVWEAPMAITSWVFGGEHFTSNAAGDHVGSVIVGMAGHMMNSAVLGVVFVGLAAALRLRGRVAAIMAGVVFFLAVWVVMRYVILPLNSGEEELFTTDVVSAQWAWWVAHAAFGMTAGIAYGVAADRLTSPEAAQRRETVPT